MSQLHPIPNSTAVSQVHLLSSKTSQQQFNCCSVRAAPGGPTQTSSYPGWLYNPVPFLRGLSLREEQNRRLEGRDSSSATRSVRLPAVAKLFVISTEYVQFCTCKVVCAAQRRYPAVWPRYRKFRAIPKFRQCKCSQLKTRRSHAHTIQQV
jgi:hypothetical protein